MFQTRAIFTFSNFSKYNLYLISPNQHPTILCFHLSLTTPLIKKFSNFSLHTIAQFFFLICFWFPCTSHMTFHTSYNHTSNTFLFPLQPSKFFTPPFTSHSHFTVHSSHTTHLSISHHAFLILITPLYLNIIYFMLSQFSL